MNTALHKHLIPFDLPVEKWAAYYDARHVLIRALDGLVPKTVFNTIAFRQDDLDGDRRNLRFPVNPLLKNASQTVIAPAANGSAT